MSPAELSPLEVDRIIEVALAEDLAAGDVTSRTVVPPDAVARGTLVAREPLVLAGLWDKWEGPEGPLHTYTILTAGQRGP